MEKRTLIAIVLSLAILLVWDFFFLQTKTTEQPKSQPAQTQSQAPVAGKPLPEAEIPQPQGGAAPAPADAGKEIVVDTPLYRATWSTRGAALISFDLKRYRQEMDPKSKTVQIIKTPMPLITLDDKFPDESLSYEAAKIAPLGQDKIPRELVFSAQVAQGVTLKKIYTINPSNYTIGLRAMVENRTAAALSVDMNISVDEVHPIDAEKSRYIFEGPVLLADKHLEEFKLSKVEKTGAYRDFSGEVKWFGFEDKYFIKALIPQKPVETTLSIKRVNDRIIRMVYDGAPVTIKPGRSAGKDYLVFAGPKELNTLKAVGHDLNKALDFGFFNIIAKPLLRAMNWINHFTKSYGWSIIILTVIIKILLYPLTLKSFTSMKALQRVQPLMKEIQARYKDDKQKLNQELMKLYSEHKINPMGGCLPMLLQIPILFALYRVFYQAIELRHTPFYVFGSWLPDLSAKDPYYITPILMGLSQFVMQKMSPQPGDAMQQKMMLMMPVVFTVLFLNFPSGLVLYWLVSNTLSIAQQAYINRKHT